MWSWDLPVEAVHQQVGHLHAHRDGLVRGRVVAVHEEAVAGPPAVGAVERAGTDSNKEAHEFSK